MAAKKGQGGTSSLFVCPLQGQGSELPCGVWGNAPTVFRALNSKGTVNKGAGSEASLPVTLRFLRSAPPSCFPQRAAHCRAKWARLTCCSARYSSSFPQAGISPLRRRQGGNENRRMSAVAANINSGVSGAFSPNTPHYSYASFSTVIFPSVTFSRTRSPSAILPPSSSSLSVSSTVR